MFKRLICLSFCLLLFVVLSMLCVFIHYNLIILLFLWKVIDCHLFSSSDNLLWVSWVFDSLGNSLSFLFLILKTCLSSFLGSSVFLLLQSAIFGVLLFEWLIWLTHFICVFKTFWCIIVSVSWLASVVNILEPTVIWGSLTWGHALIKMAECCVGERL